MLESPIAIIAREDRLVVHFDLKKPVDTGRFSGAWITDQWIDIHLIFNRMPT